MLNSLPGYLAGFYCPLPNENQTNKQRNTKNDKKKTETYKYKYLLATALTEKKNNCVLPFSLVKNRLLPFSICFFPDRFKTMNEDAIFPVDFDHPLNQELIIKPGEKSAEISVNVTEDNVPENNETFLLTLMSLDKVTTILSGSVRITILNNGKIYMSNTHT